MKKLNIILFICLFPVMGCSDDHPLLPAMATVQLLDEQGIPIKNESVGIRFQREWQVVGNGVDSKFGKTDINGEFSATGKNDISPVWIGAGKYALGGVMGENSQIIQENYYHSSCRISISISQKTGRWEPWNPTVKLHVRKKINPVPMIVSSIFSADSRLNMTFGDELAIDLEKGDLCAPYGKGIIRDFIFTIDRSDKEKGPIVKLHFSNPEDGIMFIDPKDDSNCIPNDDRYAFDYNYEFIGPRMAQERGYEDSFLWNKLIRGESKGIVFYSFEREKNDAFYIFRVRSQKDSNGNIISAKYGKIPKGFGFNIGEGGIRYVLFTYYFNPDGTRNLESDPSRNKYIDRFEFSIPRNP